MDFQYLLILNYSYQDIYIYIILENSDRFAEGAEIHSVFVLSSLRYINAFTYCPSPFSGFKSRVSRLEFGEVIFFFLQFLDVELSLKIVTCRNLYQGTQVPVPSVENSCECPAFGSTHIATIMRRHDRK